MKLKRGEIWYANLDPVKGYEQAGSRPVIIFQNNLITKIASTAVAIPLTTNLKQARKKTCVFLSTHETGLVSDSVVLCHQIRILDKSRFDRKIGKLSRPALKKVEKCILFTLGFSTAIITGLCSWMYWYF